RTSEQEPFGLDAGRSFHRVEVHTIRKFGTEGASSGGDMTEPQLIRYNACGATNRVPREKLQAGLEPVCGRCHTPLPIPRKAVSVTDATFAAEVGAFDAAGAHRHVGS